jgi:hypothetical protein
MKPISSLAPLVLTALLALGPLAPDPASPHQALVPPQRVRVTIGGEAVELALGETLTRPGQPDLKVELLPTRVFELPDVCRFEFPREWSCSGVLATPEPADGWWHLGGGDLAIFLRRHGGDAATVLEEYVTNLERGNGSARAAALVQLGGRWLEGFQVRYSSGGMHGMPDQARVQEVYAFTVGGNAFLLTLDKLLEEPDSIPLYLDLYPSGEALPTLVQEVQVSTSAAASAQLLLSTTWRWLDE